MLRSHPWRIAASAIAATLLWSTPGLAQPLAMTEDGFPASIFQQILPERATPQRPAASEPADEQASAVPALLRRQIVSYPTREAPGTIVIDTPHTYLYYVLGDGRAIRYGIGVGREGFTWSGVRSVERKQEWPDWIPPEEMIARQPYLPRFMAGGPGNPLGARAMYLGDTLYRIHGTNQPSSIGQHVSSGCIRMLNADAIDLFNRTPVGTRVVVLNDARHVPDDVASLRPSPRPRLTQLAPPPAEAARPVAVRQAADSLYSGASASRLY